MSLIRIVAVFALIQIWAILGIVAAIVVAALVRYSFAFEQVEHISYFKRVIWPIAAIKGNACRSAIDEELGREHSLRKSTAILNVENNVETADLNKYFLISIRMH